MGVRRVLYILNRAVSEAVIVRILGWPRLQSRRDCLKCILVFQCMNGLAPSYLRSDFTQAKKYHTYITRHRDLTRLPLAKSTKSIHFFFRRREHVLKVCLLKDRACRETPINN